MFARNFYLSTAIALLCASAAVGQMPVEHSTPLASTFGASPRLGGSGLLEHLRPAEVGNAFGGWFATEVLAWKLSSQRLPPLLTTNPGDDAGTHGASDTAVLVDNDRLEGYRAGLRLSGGVWLDECKASALEMNAFALQHQASDRSFASSGDPVLARPFFDAFTRHRATEYVAFPGLVAGEVAVCTGSDLWGFEVLYRHSVDAQLDGRADVLGGFRFVQLNDSVTLIEQKRSAGITTTIYDRFRTCNTFNGIEGGLSAHMAAECFHVTAVGKLAVGCVQQVTDAFGETTTGSATLPRGLLAGPTNFDRREHTRLAAIPEVGFDIGYQATGHLRLTAGYTFMYLCNFARAGEQIDTGSNGSSSQIQKLTAPRRNETDVRVHGAILGLEYCW